MQLLLDGINPSNIRYLFYAVTPNETIYGDMHEVPDLFNKASVWLLLLVIIEFITHPDEYAFNDTITSLNAGMLSMLLKIGGKGLTALLYVPLYNALHIVDLPVESPWTWILCFLTQDLMYYLGHRAIHEAGVFWSFHQMHHSSEYYNLSTALRQGAVQEFAMCLFDLLQVFVMPPSMWLPHKYLNVLYQYWLHTQAVPYLGPVEYVLNTPSSHRVHHGRNPYCIDRNYGGTLIVWDRLFGTYARERDDEKVVYGLVDPVKSFNQLWLQFFEFKALGFDKARLRDEQGNELFPGAWNKFKATFGPPGYFPGVQTRQFFWWRCMVDNEEGIPEINAKSVVVHDPPLSLPIKGYLLAQMMFVIYFYMGFVEARASSTWADFFLQIIVLISTMQMFGYYFDHDPKARTFDASRLAVVFSAAVYGGYKDVAVYACLSLASIAVQGMLGTPIAASRRKTAKKHS